MAGISQKTIDQVNASIDIVDVVSRYLELNKNNKALCPFHNDHKPSLSVSPQKQIFKCFVCETKGGAIQFIMQKENITYPQAIETLANMYNIVIEYNDKKYQKNYDKRSQMMEIYDIAKKTYHNNLYSDAGLKCLEYIKNRGISDSTLKELEAGYCPKGKSVLREKVKGKYSTDTLNDSKLIRYAKDKYMVFFSGRLIFPLIDRDDTIAFSGRKLNENDFGGKYINSTDTLIYKKSNVLYGLNKTKDYIKEKKYVIIVEGPMDFISLYENGIKNIVSPWGTALGNNQIKLLKMITKNIYINFDTDEGFAGQNNAIKAGYTLFKNGIEPKIIAFPTIADPDDFIKEKGTDAYLKCVKKSKKLFDFHYEVYQAINKEHASPQGFVDEVKNNIASINDQIYREIAIQNLSKVINVSSESIHSVVNEIINKQKNYEKIKAQIKTNNENKNQKTTSIIEKNNLLEDDFIRICLSKEHSIRKFIFDNTDISWIESDIHKKLYEHINIHLTSENLPEISLIINNITETDVSEKAVDIIIDIENSFSDINIAKDCLIRLEKKSIQKELDTLREKLKECDENSSIENMKNITTLEQKLKKINTKYN